MKCLFTPASVAGERHHVYERTAPSTHQTCLNGMKDFSKLKEIEKPTPKPMIQLEKRCWNTLDSPTTLMTQRVR